MNIIDKITMWVLYLSLLGMVMYHVYTTSSNAPTPKSFTETPAYYTRIGQTNYVIDADGDTLKQTVSIHYSYQTLTKEEKRELFKRLKR